MRFQRPDAAFQFRQNVAQAKQIFFGGGKALVGVVAAVTEMGNPGGFFEHIAAFAGFGRYHFGDFALPDNRIAVAAETCVHKQFVNIAKPRVLAVDEIFTFARTVIATGDGNFVGVFRQRAVAVIKAERYLGKAFGFSKIRPHKNDIFHFRAAQIFRGLLTEHPADGVGNVALAAAVRTDDRGDAFVKFQDGFIRKGFKPLHFQ